MNVFGQEIVYYLKDFNLHKEIEIELFKMRNENLLKFCKMGILKNKTSGEEKCL